MCKDLLFTLVTNSSAHLESIDIMAAACLSACTRIFPPLLIILCCLLYALKIVEPLYIHLKKSYTCVHTYSFFQVVL